MIKFRIDVPIYDDSLLVFLDCDYHIVSDYVYKKYGIIIGDGSCNVSELISLDDGTDTYYILWCGDILGDYRCNIVHELGHYCIRILNRRGIDINVDNSEPFCYLLSFMNGKMEAKINKEISNGNTI